MPRASRDDEMFEKISKMIDEKLGQREQREREEKDPWARMEGIVDRSVKKHFDALAEDKGEEERPRRQPKSDDDEGGSDLLKILTGS